MSAAGNIFESMFDSEFAAASDVELVAAIEDGVRQEAIAGARRLAAIAELIRRSVEEDDERGRWAFDPWDSAAARWPRRWRGAAPRVRADADRGGAARSLARGGGAVLRGRLSTRLVSAITWGTRLVDSDACGALIDAAIAERAVGWGRLSEDKLRAPSTRCRPL